MIILICIILWLLVGGASFIYWWTKDHDFNLIDIDILFCGMLCGPISFIAGGFLYGKWNSIFHNITIIKKRG